MGHAVSFSSLQFTALAPRQSCCATLPGLVGLSGAFVLFAPARATRFCATVLMVHPMGGSPGCRSAGFRFLAVAYHGFCFLGLARDRTGGVGRLAEGIACGGSGSTRELRALIRQRAEIFVKAADVVFDPFLLNRNRFAQVATAN